MRLSCHFIWRRLSFDSFLDLGNSDPLQKNLQIKHWIDLAVMSAVRRVGFWSEGLYHFNPIEGFQSTDATSKSGCRKWILVVGRRHYFETVKEYPIAHLKDLKSVLKNEPWRFPYPGLQQHKIERLSENSHRVTFWIIKQEVLESLKKLPMFILPESVCAAAQAQGSLCVFDRLGEAIYITESKDGLLSSAGWQESFLLTAGLPSSGGEGRDYVLRRFEGLDCSNAILGGVLPAIKSSPLTFLSGFDRKTLTGFPWKGVMRTSVLLCVVYALVTSVYLVRASSWVEYQIEKKRPLAESSLSVRQEIEGYRARLGHAETILGNAHPMWVAWDLLIDLRATGVILRAVNSKPPDVTFYLTAPKATDVMTWLSEDDRVESVDVVVAVEDFNGMQRFALKVTPVENILTGDIEKATALELGALGGQGASSDDQQAGQQDGG